MKIIYIDLREKTHKCPFGEKSVEYDLSVSGRVYEQDIIIWSHACTTCKFHRGHMYGPRFSILCNYQRTMRLAELCM